MPIFGRSVTLDISFAHYKKHVAHDDALFTSKFRYLSVCTFYSFYSFLYSIFLFFNNFRHVVSPMRQKVILPGVCAASASLGGVKESLCEELGIPKEAVFIVGGA